MDSRTAEPALDILVVDSDPATRLFLSKTLGLAGYDVTATNSFYEAKHHLETACPALLIADVRLGEFNGLHLALHRHIDHPGLPTIITHVTFDRVLRAEAERLGAIYLVKPVRPHELMDEVAKLVDVGQIRLAMIDQPRPGLAHSSFS